MDVGFRVTAQRNEAEVKIFGEDADDPERGPRLVSLSRRDGICAVVMGRFYYSESVWHQLRPGGPEPREAGAKASAEGDAALALSAYRRWGIDGLTGLEGDFAAVIWDAARRRLIGLRDPMGGYPLFWLARNGVVALATSPTHLLQLRDVEAELNPDYLAEFLMLSGVGVDQVSSEASAFKGVYRVQPGTFIQAEVPDGPVESRCYWNWEEHFKDPGTSSLETLGEGLGDVLKGAIAQRLCYGRAAAHLSGGMDSTAVALVASDLIAAGAGTPPIHALSLVYERMQGLAGESEFLQSVVGRPGLSLHQIPGDELCDFDGFVDPPPHDEPWPNLARLASERALVRVARDLGARTILSGIGADQILAVPPVHIADLIQRLRPAEAWTEAVRWARGQNCSVWTVLRPNGLSPLRPAWPWGEFRRPISRTRLDWDRITEFSVPPWIRPEFARQYNLAGLAARRRRENWNSCSSLHLSCSLSSATRRRGDMVSWHLGSAHGIVTTHPFQDPRVICFCLGALSRFRGIPGGQKPILAQAMRDLLPEKIISRKRKGNFNELYLRGLSRNAPNLEAMIHDAPAEDTWFLNKPLLVHCLRRAAVGDAGNARASGRLSITLSLLRWLGLRRTWGRQVASRSATYRLG